MQTEGRVEYTVEVNTVSHFLLECSAVEKQLKDVLLFVLDAGMDTVFAEQISATFRQHYRTFFYDRRGTGRSGGDASCTPDDLYADLEGIIAYILELTGQRKVTLVATGYGTALAMRFLHYHREQVDFYVGISQVTCPRDYEKARCKAMELVFNMKNQMKNVLFMSQIADLTDGSYQLDLLPKKLETRVRFMQHGMGMHQYKRDQRLIKLAKRSPYFDAKLGKSMLKESMHQTEELYRMEKLFDLENYDQLGTAAGLLISGRHDFVNPYMLVREYQEHVLCGMELQFVDDGDADLLYEDPIQCFAMLYQNRHAKG